MAKIIFTSTQQADSTHRVSDGAESSYFAWSLGVNASKIVAAYASGYDCNGSDDAVEITVYNLDNEVVFEDEF